MKATFSGSSAAKARPARGSVAAAAPPAAEAAKADETPTDDVSEESGGGGLDNALLLLCAAGGLALAGGFVYMRRRRRKGAAAPTAFEGTATSQMPGSFHGASLHGGSLHGSSLTAEGTGITSSTSALPGGPIGGPEPKSEPPRLPSSADHDDDGGTDPRGGGKKKAKKGEPATDAKRPDAHGSGGTASKVVAQAAVSPSPSPSLAPTQISKFAVTEPEGGTKVSDPKTAGKALPAPFDKWVEMRVAQEVWAERGEPAAANLQATFGVSLIEWVKINAHWNEKFLADPALKARHDELAPGFRGKYAKGSAA
jgi:hypothetical protein